MHTYSAIFSAENTQAGNSLLKDRVGETIAFPFLQIVDDPFHPDGLFSRTFDSEGVATQQRSIVTDGKLITVEKIGSDLEFSVFGQGGYVGSPSLLIKGLAVTID